MENSVEQNKHYIATNSAPAELIDSISLTSRILQYMIEEKGDHDALFVGLQNNQNQRLYQRLEGQPEYGANKLLISQNGRVQRQRDITNMGLFIANNEPVEHIIFCISMNKDSYGWIHHDNRAEKLHVELCNYGIDHELLKKEFYLQPATENLTQAPAMVKRVYEQVLDKKI